MALPELGYWGSRGTANPVRCLLEYVGQKYVYKNWMKEPPPGWSEGKHTLGLEFPNLPYYIDDDVRLTQSHAIMRYLAKKHGLGAREEDRIEQDMISFLLADVRDGIQRTVFLCTDFEKDRVTFRTEWLTGKFDQLERRLEQNELLLGSYLTYSDFALFEIVELIDRLYPDIMKQYPCLWRHHEHMHNLKGVKEYMESDRLPEVFYGPKCKWPQESQKRKNQRGVQVPNGIPEAA